MTLTPSECVFDFKIPFYILIYMILLRKKISIQDGKKEIWANHFFQRKMDVGTQKITSKKLYVTKGIT